MAAYLDVLDQLQAERRRCYELYNEVRSLRESLDRKMHEVNRAWAGKNEAERQLRAMKGGGVK